MPSALAVVDKIIKKCNMHEDNASPIVDGNSLMLPKKSPCSCQTVLMNWAAQGYHVHAVWPKEARTIHM